MEILHYNIDMTPESSWQIVSAGAFAKDNLLYLQEAGHFISGVNYYTVRKDLDSYLVKLTLSGAGILEYGGETCRLSAGSFFWIDCRAPQHYYTAPDAGQWDVLWFHFYGATAGAYYQAFLSQTQGRAAASLPVDSPVSAQMSALLALAGEDGGGLPGGSKRIKKEPTFGGFFLAPQVGLEPTTLRLTAECSAIELLRNMVD